MPSPPRTDGNGYVDFGQDDFDDAEYSGDEEPLNKRAKGAEEGGGTRSAGAYRGPTRGGGGAVGGQGSTSEADKFKVEEIQ